MSAGPKVATIFIDQMEGDFDTARGVLEGMGVEIFDRDPRAKDLIVALVNGLTLDALEKALPGFKIEVR